MANDQTGGQLEGCTIIFDLDGTLIDTAGDLAASMNYALGKLDVPEVPLAEVRGLVGHGARVMIKRGFLLNTGAEPSRDLLDEALSYFLEHYEANIAVHSRPFEGVLELIEGWRDQGASIAICTNKRERLARLLISALSLDSQFDVIVGADTTSAAKPDPAPVKLCLEATDAKRAVFFGDSDTDIRAAKAAGVPCLIGDFGYGPLDLANEAAALFSSYLEIAPTTLSLLNAASR